jgi:hypothetical protein
VLGVECSAWRSPGRLAFGAYSTEWVTRCLAFEEGSTPQTFGKGVWSSSTALDAIHFCTQTKRDGEIILKRKLFKTSRTMSWEKNGVDHPSHKTVEAMESSQVAEVHIRDGIHPSLSSVSQIPYDSQHLCVRRTRTRAEQRSWPWWSTANKFDNIRALCYIPYITCNC